MSDSFDENSLLMQDNFDFAAGLANYTVDGGKEQGGKVLPYINDVLINKRRVFTVIGVVVMGLSEYTPDVHQRALESCTRTLNFLKSIPAGTLPADRVTHIKSEIERIQSLLGEVNLEAMEIEDQKAIEKEKLADIANASADLDEYIIETLNIADQS